MTATAELMEFLATLPGRCPQCGFATREQGHRGDCPNRSEWTTFVAALKQAVRHDGTVHQGDIRPLIRGRIEPKHIGQQYKRAIREHILREIDREQSNDEQGRNTNKWEPVYRLRSAA